MSLHPIPLGIDIARARALCIAHLREPSGVVYANGLNSPPTAVEFTPDLLPDEQATLAQIISAAQRTPDTLSMEAVIAAEMRGLRALINLPTPSQSDVDGLVAYYNLVSPTAAQTASALKASWRVLGSLARVVRAVVRDE